MRKHIQACIKICKDQGASVTSIDTGRKHLVFKTSLGLFVFPLTPSNHRWQPNMRSVLRRAARAAR